MGSILGEYTSGQTASTVGVAIAGTSGATSTDTCVLLGTTTSIFTVNSGAKLLAVGTDITNTATRNDYFYVTKSGINVTGTVVATSNVTALGGTFYASNGNSLTLSTNIAATGTPTAIIADTQNSLTNAGSKLLSIRNNTVEQAYVRYDGFISASGLYVVNAVQSGTDIQSGSGKFAAASGTVAMLTSTLGAGASDVATKVGSATVDTSGTTISATAKLLSLKMGIGTTETEAGFFVKDGTYLTQSGVGFGEFSSARGVTTATTGGFFHSGASIGIYNANGAAYLALYPGTGNSACSGAFLAYGESQTNTAFKGFNGTSYTTTAIASGLAATGTPVAVTVDTTNAFTNVGSKLLSIRNATVEKAYIDYAGNANFSGGLTIGGTFSPSSFAPVSIDTTAANTWSKAQRGAVTVLTASAGAIAVDLSLACNYSFAAAATTTAYTLSAPTNATAGQSGMIVITQGATTASTLAYNAFWKFAGGVAPVLTATAGAIDVLTYYVPASGYAICQLLKDIK